MRILFAVILFFLTISSKAQISAENMHMLKAQEDSLKYFSHKMIFDSFANNRFHFDSAFIRSLVKALKTPYSFEYPFDSILTVSRLYAPDSSFRIFTWQLQRDESYYRQEGAIQMKTKDGSLKLFGLLDASDFTGDPADSVRSNKNWIGAIYYNIIMKEYKGKKYYTLLGYDDNNLLTTRKWIEVLTFNSNGEPVFGGNYFDYKDDELKPQQPVDRFLLEYKKDARARLNYDPDLNEIVFEHLISESNEPQKRFTLIPDGDYEGFKWENGKWVHIDKLFNQQLKDGQAPRPQPLYDDINKPD
ncbi:MAG: hypothetical protein JST21_16885 [Bacteroidetes bacterium]|nr:hypothetical protein [Bacteroidota bacterium]